LLTDGYTNENQILGAGSGFGNNIQTLAFSWNKGWEQYGIKFQHIKHNPIGVTNILNPNGGSPQWEDFSYGALVKKKYGNILFNLNVDWVNSKNYVWLDNRIANNMYIFLNTIYLW
jgi:hypothetical protein